MGHPCSIQGGLARRLCILFVCTDPLSALAPKLQETSLSLHLHVHYTVRSVLLPNLETGPEGPEFKSNRRLTGRDGRAHTCTC